MDLSIIILNYHNKNLTKELLKNLVELNLPYNYEVIVVDNASYDGIADIVVDYKDKYKDAWQNLIFIQSKKNAGFAYGNNLGIKQADGEYIMIMNPDLAILSNAVERLCAYMQKNKEVALAGPRLINADKSVQYSCTEFPDWRLPLYRRTFWGNTAKGKKWLSKYLMKDFDHNKDAYVSSLFGACLIFRKSVLDKVGFLDERYFMYMEDLDWSRRFWQAGFKVAYVGTAEVIHLHRRQSAGESLPKTIFSKSARHHIISFVKYLLKFKGQELPKTTQI